MEEHTQGSRERRRLELTQQHYRTVSAWLERLGLLTAASLVVQKMVAGASLGDPVVIIGVIVSFMIYASALLLLLRS